MALLRLRDLASGEEQDFHRSVIRIGRDPELEIVPSGPVAEVVSAHHLRLVFEQGQWWIEDTGSSNGTYLDNERLVAGKKHPLVRGSEVRLGRGGPHFSVVETGSRRVSPTRIEEEVIDSAAVTTPMSPMPPVDVDPGEERPSTGEPALTLRDVGSDSTYQCRGPRVRIGRARDCDVQLIRDEDTSVSRKHAEIRLASGRATLRDLGSRNGTFVNGSRISGEYDLSLDDRIELGPGGPVLIVEAMSIPGSSPQPKAPDKQLMTGVSPASLGSGWARRRSFGGKGRTMFVKQVVEDTHRHHSRRMRRVVWSGVLVIALSVGGVYWFTEMRARETDLAIQATAQALEQQQLSSDSLRLAATIEIERLGNELEDARATSAPASVVDSLRHELDSARERTVALEQALGRAQSDIAAQLASVDSIRRAREEEVARLRDELERASERSVSQGLLDSLRAAVVQAEERAQELDSQARAIQGTNLAAVAQANQAAVGLVWAYTDNQVVFGSGFIVTPSGYFVTNRHVVMHTGRRADSVFVTMADQQQRVRTRVARIPAESVPDLAVLQISDYRGPVVAGVDWDGDGAVQGEPAAIIGFPAGLNAAVDETATVRTSMNAGIFSKITTDRVQFDGFTITGSSGSPIFNAAGEVVAVHRAGLRDAVGLSFAVPVSLVGPMLPPEAQRELGLALR